MTASAPCTPSLHAPTASSCPPPWRPYSTASTKRCAVRAQAWCQHEVQTHAREAAFERITATATSVVSASATAVLTVGTVSNFNCLSEHFVTGPATLNVVAKQSTCLNQW